MSNVIICVSIKICTQRKTIADYVHIYEYAVLQVQSTKPNFMEQYNNYESCRSNWRNLVLQRYVFHFTKLTQQFAQTCKQRRSRVTEKRHVSSYPAVVQSYEQKTEMSMIRNIRTMITGLANFMSQRASI